MPDDTGVAPALLAISHGTDSVRGRAAVGGLVAAVRSRFPDTRGGFVDVLQPDVATVLGKLPPGSPAVIVPLLLSAGYHVRVDLARVARRTDRPVIVSGALGPDEGLVELLTRRLQEAGLHLEDELVLAAAGSSDAAAVADCHDTARRLAARLGRPVRIGFLSAASPRLPEAVAAARSTGRRVVISTYLLAPGYFLGLAKAAGADVVAEPLLDGGPVPDELVKVVLARYAAAIGVAPAEAPLTGSRP
jgi:sirohydrochlorin ferrochelatase